MNKLLRTLQGKSIGSNPLLIAILVSCLPILVLTMYISQSQDTKAVLSIKKTYAVEPSEAKACVVGSPDKKEWAVLNSYDTYFKNAGEEFGIDPNILKAMAMIESNGVGQYDANGNVIEGPDNYGGCSAKGVMQIKDCYWAGVAAEIDANMLEPEGNIRTAAKLMSDWTEETGSWQNAITQKYHPGTGQHGKTQSQYVTDVENYLVELGGSGCKGDSGKDTTPRQDPGSNVSGCVVTKVGNPQVSPTLPPECGSAPGEYSNPLATPQQMSRGDLNKIVTGIATEMAAYAGDFSYGGHIEHAGLDIGTNGGAQSPVYAITDGKVTLITIHDGAGNCVDAVSGCTLRLEHTNDEFSSEYVHIDPSVQEGDTIKKGQQIGTVHVWEVAGGYNDHLHLELRLTSNRFNINPRIYFPEFEQFPIAPGYNGDVRAFSASRNIFLEEGGGTWAQKFRDHPPCADKTPGWCWAM